jgi:hypothetical protein
LASGFPSNPCDTLADIGHLWWAWPPSNPLPLSGTVPILGRLLSGVVAPAAAATGRRTGEGDVAGLALLVSKEKERPWNATERLLVVVVVPALDPAASPAPALLIGRGRSTETDRLGSGDAKRREGVEAEVEEVELELENVVEVEVEVEVEVDVDLEVEEGPRR